MAKKRYYDSGKSMGDGMIKEDRSAIANLPQQVIMKQYPESPYGNDYGLNDNIRGIDVQMSEDKVKPKKGNYPNKW